MKLRKKPLISSFAVGAVVTVLVFALDRVRDYGALHSLCDGFFVASVILLGVGGLKLARNKGSFDLAAYGISNVFLTAFPMLRQREKETPLEYVERKREERKPAAEMLLAGAVYLAAALAALAAYEMTK